jgi:hypothetical protein
MFSGTAQVSHQVCQFFVSSVCLHVHMTMVDKTRLSFAFAGHIGHNVIRKEENKV